MKYYHGTEKLNDKFIIGPPPSIDINKGGGEIGKGFYTTNDEWIAIAWAIGRFGKDEASVLEIDLEDKNRTSLAFTIMLIKTQREVIKIWKKLKKKKQTRTFEFGYDIVNAPFATIDAARQYKFESKKAETILNSSSIKKIL